jgi:6-phosphogluconate dehydrogenase (decarboxylating)
MRGVRNRLSKPHAYGLWRPAAVVDSLLDCPALLLERGAIVIDGGNSSCRDDIRCAEQLKPIGIKTSIAERAVACGIWSEAIAW